jgi:hypothetical protein
MGLKVSPGILPWGWKDRDLPIPQLYAAREGPPPGYEDYINVVDGATIYSVDEPYASVTNDQGRQPCQASGSGGQVIVKCINMQAGHLVVEENMRSGWYAWMDGAPIQLRDNPWLEVGAPKAAILSCSDTFPGMSRLE